MYFNGVDEDFLKTYEIELVEGRNFSPHLASDTAAVLLNETAAKTLFADSPIAKIISVPSRNFQGRVVGVVSDFHFYSLHEKIGPLVMGFMPNSGSHALHGIDYFTLRISSANIGQTIEFITKVHEQFDVTNPIELSFLEGWLHDLYLEDDRLGKIFGISAGLAIVIACVGLFGLSAFMAEQRIKEIGIRKTLGASLASIIALLTKDFMKLVLLGILVASPIAYFAMREWLQDFAYRIDINNIWPFVLSGLAALVIASLTVGYQSIRAALANPVKALKYE